MGNITHLPPGQELLRGVGSGRAGDGLNSPWEGARRTTSMQPVRILVLWNACRAISTDEDARWVRDEIAKLGDSTGVTDLRLHRLESAALRHPSPWDWCLEMAVDQPANSVVRSPACAEFLADLRLLGTRPAVIVLPEVAA